MRKKSRGSRRRRKLALQSQDVGCSQEETFSTRTSVTRQPTATPTYDNKPYIQTLRDLGETTELVESFMRDSASADRFVPALERVTSFCPEDTLESLRSTIPSSRIQSVALVDDWSIEGTGADVVYKSSGPLDPKGLHDLLLEKASRTVGPTRANAAKRSKRPTRLNSERLVIFIINPSCLSIAAIISSATINEARPLRGMFDRYLGFESFIGEISPPSQFPLDQLAFDLPFYTIKTAPYHARPRDSRRMGDKGPLRRVTDLRFLSRCPKADPPTAGNFLCEAQVSLLITGTSHLKWTAYCFVDSYFEDKGLGESVANFLEERKEYQGDVHYDPLTGGQSDAEIPSLPALEYFLIVAEPRLRQYKDEWHILVTKLREKIENYIETCPLTRKTLAGPPNAQCYSDIRNSRLSILDAEELLVKVAHKLETTLNWWKRCDTNHMFATIPQRASACLPEIRDHFKNMEMYLEELEYIRQMCVRYKDELAFHLSHEGRVDVKDQIQKISFSQAMTQVMLVVMTPIAVAAAILSMQPKAIPRPFAVNPASFISLAIILMAFVRLSVATVLNWDYIKNLFKRLKQLVFRDMELNGDIELSAVEHQEMM